MKNQIKDMNMKELGGFICDALITKDGISPINQTVTNPVKT